MANGVAKRTTMYRGKSFDVKDGVLVLKEKIKRKKKNLLTRGLMEVFRRQDFLGLKWSNRMTIELMRRM